MTRSIVQPQQTVLILQGGGALGAFQAGVHAGLTAAGLLPDWVIGTSIGAINAAIIAGNPPQRRLEHLHEFWARVGQGWLMDPPGDPASGLPPLLAQINAWSATLWGIPAFFRPHWFGSAGLASGSASPGLYDTTPLWQTLDELIDLDYLNASPVRLSVGAVDVESGRMRYFDTRHERIDLRHIVASGALPPAFASVEIDGRHYWDGGLHSNTPLEWMLRDQPRRHSLCIMATLWPQVDALPTTLPEVLRRHKELQYASRAETLIGLEEEMHRLRHGISLLAHHVPPDAQADPAVAQALAAGCRSVYHLVRLQAPRLPHETQAKDIDFVPSRIDARWQAGYHDALCALARRPWETPVAPEDGLVLHDFSASGLAEAGA